jgi:hypothetical protein
MMNVERMTMLHMLLLAAALAVAAGTLRQEITGLRISPAVAAAFSCPYLMPPECVEPLPGL